MVLFLVDNNVVIVEIQLIIDENGIVCVQLRIGGDKENCIIIVIVMVLGEIMLIEMLSINVVGIEIDINGVMFVIIGDVVNVIISLEDFDNVGIVGEVFMLVVIDLIGVDVMVMIVNNVELVIGDEGCVFIQFIVLVLGIYVLIVSVLNI